LALPLRCYRRERDPGCDGPAVSVRPHACAADHLSEPHEKSAAPKRCQCDSRSNFLQRISEFSRLINRLITIDLQTGMFSLIKCRGYGPCDESRKRSKNLALKVSCELWSPFVLLRHRLGRRSSGDRLGVRSQRASSLVHYPYRVEPVFFNGFSDSLFIGSFFDGCIFLAPFNQSGFERKLPVFAHMPFQFEPERGPVICRNSPASLGRRIARLRHFSSPRSISRCIATDMISPG
jgi:hypothetical protein